MNGKDIQLITALEDGISHISAHFGDDWLLAGAIGAGSSRVLPAADEARLNIHFKPEVHLFTEACICVEGELVMELEGTFYRVEENGVCVIPPGESHQECSLAGVSYSAIWLVAGPRTVTLHLSGKTTGDDQFFTLDYQTVPARPEHIALMEEIQQEAAGAAFGREAMMKAAMLRFMISLRRDISSATATDINGNGGRSSWKAELAARIEAYINANCHKNIRLGALSQEFCISPNYLNAVFKSVTGKTIIRFAEECRIQKAKQLLDTGESIGYVAHYLGYYDQYHFSKSFKKETGLSPSGYMAGLPADNTAPKKRPM